MGYKITIRNNKTNEKRVVDTLLEWGYASFDWWATGTGGCDCTRHWYFEDSEDEDLPCGEELYSVLQIELPTYEIIKIDSK